MRPPFADPSPENTPSDGDRQPSVPDHVSRSVRQNVREIMRQPSTPWITFDRGSKIDLASAARRSFFPLSERPPAPVVEPSNVVVATDVGVDPTTTTEALAIDPAALALAEESLPVSRASGWKVAAALTLGLAALAGGRALLASPTPTAPVAAAAARPADPAPIDLGAAAPAPVSESPAVAEEPADKPAPAKAESADKPEARWGRLTIRGAARHHRVYMDGKLMLGSGARSFTVKCGEHKIAVGKKAEPQDLEVPCNGELVLSK